MSGRDIIADIENKLANVKKLRLQKQLEDEEAAFAKEEAVRQKSKLALLTSNDDTLPALPAKVASESSQHLPTSSSKVSNLDEYLRMQIFQSNTNRANFMQQEIQKKLLYESLLLGCANKK